MIFKNNFGYYTVYGFSDSNNKAVHVIHLVISYSGDKASWIDMLKEINAH